MNTAIQNKVSDTITELYIDSRNDKVKMMKGAVKSLLGKMQPSNFEDVYLSISSDQGEHLTKLILQHKLKNIVEFGTSFGISTLFLAQGAMETGGHIITTELLESKAKRAIENFKKAEVHDIIEVRIGDAMDTLKNHNQPVDLLLLDGWKNLYLPVFRMLEHNFHKGTYIYVDNANMAESKTFLNTIASSNKYNLVPMFNGSVVLVNLKQS